MLPCLFSLCSCGLSRLIEGVPLESMNTSVALVMMDQGRSTSCTCLCTYSARTPREKLQGDVGSLPFHANLGSGPGCTNSINSSQMKQSLMWVAQRLCTKSRVCECWPRSSTSFCSPLCRPPKETMAC
ncbi:hypothetical protein B0T10DRAFT_468239 [Thelonectria olida]|uniref:Secreted protein n=1 Tax=Thelonectria olida TaxID=1576542 RepID=A0A9P9AVQ7_9HYPO|nr:hypothetical protein B0T10DRAFT_468239 [Thelonectria olida]